MIIILEREEIYQAIRDYVEEALGIDIDDSITKMFDGMCEITSPTVKITTDRKQR